MRPIIPWRARSAFVLFVPAVALVALYGAGYVDLTPISGYWTAVGSGSAIFLFISCAVASASGAMEGARARRGRLRAIGASRPYLHVLVVQLWPSIVVAGIAQAIAFVLLARDTWGAPGSVPPSLPVAFAAIVFFHTALGYALGRILALPAGIPVALLMSYSWLGFTWSVDYFPLRYLAGLALSGCCRVDGQLDVQATLAAIVSNLGAGVAVLLLTAITAGRPRQPRSLLTPTAGLALLVVSAVVGLNVAQSLGPYPSQPRSQAQLHCDDGHPSICLYPELEIRTEPAETLRRATANLEHIGIPVPDRIVASGQASTADTLNVALRPVMSSAATLYSFATAFLQPQLAATCRGAGDDDRRARSLAAATIIDWLAIRSSVGIVDTPPSSGYPEGAAPAQRLLTLSDAEQVAWYTRNLSALTDCSMTPTPPPSA